MHSSFAVCPFVFQFKTKTEDFFSRKFSLLGDRQELLIKLRRDEGPQLIVILMSHSYTFTTWPVMSPAFGTRDVAFTGELVTMFKFQKKQMKVIGWFIDLIPFYPDGWRCNALRPDFQNTKQFADLDMLSPFLHDPTSLSISWPAVTVYLIKNWPCAFWLNQLSHYVIRCSKIVLFFWKDHEALKFLKTEGR